MKVLVTGAQGQLGRDLVCELSGNRFHFDVVGLGRDELDVCDLNSVKMLLQEFMPNVIVHSAAYTAVDKAEGDIDEAFRVNACGSRNVAVAAEMIGAKVCYISTDYVFDGTSSQPYREFDVVNPRTVYGQSKLAGEVLTQTLSSHYFIVRTSWVYGKYGNNFVKTMLNLGGKKELRVVSDQIGSPTYTVDLARFIGELVLTEKYGIYHASNRGSCSWYDFAKAIFEEAGLVVNLYSCTTDEFPRPASRPKYSVLDHSAIRINELKDLPVWRDGLQRFLREK